MSGLQAFVERARAMADDIDVSRVVGSRLYERLQDFRANDFPDCEHGCVGGVVLNFVEDSPWNTPVYVIRPCPIHGGEK